LKLLSPDVTHKTDVGGVALDLEGDADVRAAFERIQTKARAARPEAHLEGVTVQPMVRAPHGFELIVGSRKDPTFGMVLMVGTGGVNAEVFGDRALGFPPLNERLARRMLQSLRAWPLLEGFRGRPGVNADRLIEVLMRMSYLIADFPEIVELDVNPLLATPEDVVALDARVVVDRALVGKAIEPYSHLALRPYPEEYVREEQMKDGTPITLRPIRPEDEPLWKEMLARCSPQTIHSRFRAAVAWGRHDVATRYCFIDYDREIAIVAEHAENGTRELAGVGRLIADPDHETVEYAVLVRDDWQDRGLGGMLTDFCDEIARHWGLRRIVAETDPDNYRMLALFRDRGYVMQEDESGEVVEVVKDLP